MSSVKVFKLDDGKSIDSIAKEAAEVLREGGLVCLPYAGRYRIFADLTNNDAVMRLMQAKSRIKTAPALVFIGGEEELDQVADDVPPLARKLASEMWPQAITIRVKPSSELPGKVIKQLGGKKVRLGVRTPEDSLARIVVKEVGAPLLVSSANRQKKAGASSPAQVAKTFGPHVDLFVNDGDLKPEPASTIVSVVDDKVVVERQGSVELGSDWG